MVVEDVLRDASKPGPQCPALVVARAVPQRAHDDLLSDVLGLDPGHTPRVPRQVGFEPREDAREALLEGLGYAGSDETVGHVPPVPAGGPRGCKKIPGQWARIDHS